MRRFLLILALVLGISCVAGCDVDFSHLGPYNPMPTETTPSTNKVAYFGDSLGAMSRGPCTPSTPPPCTSMRDLWATRPEYSISDETIIGGTEFQNWLPSMAKLEAGTTVVLELGTNNCILEPWMDIEVHLRQVLDTMRAQGITRTIWFTINEYSAQLKNTSTNHMLSRVRWLNQYMRDLLASGEYSDIGFEIHDWDAAARPLGNSILSADNLHHNVTGNNLFAQHLVDAVLPQTA